MDGARIQVSSGGPTLNSTAAQPALAIDRMSSARRLADDELRTWAAVARLSGLLSLR